jgi:anti-anti-sigma regulatory factor
LSSAKDLNPQAMLRINGKASRSGERLELEGRLTTASIPELEKAIAEARRRSTDLALDVSELTFLDSEGALALRQLQRQNVAIHGASAFVAELLGLERPFGPPRGDACRK